MDYIATYVDGHKSATISHHGVKGMHWGDRRYQNPDGSLTPLGREHYGIGQARGGPLGAAVGKVVGVYKERQERKKDPDRLTKEERAVFDGAKKLEKKAAIKDPGYIKVKDKRSGGQAFVNVENKKTAATSLSSLGYSVQDIANKLHMQESEVEYFLYGGDLKGSGQNTTRPKSWVEEAANDPEHWQLIDDTPGERLYKRIEPSKSSGRYKTGKKASDEATKSIVDSARKELSKVILSEESPESRESFNRYLKTRGPLERASDKLTRFELQRTYTRSLSKAKAHMNSLRNSGYSNAEIAKMIGVSESTVSKYLNM